MKNKIGVIGSGNFGTALSVLLSHKSEVLLYCRKKETAHLINSTHSNLGWSLPSSLRAVNSLEEICVSCTVIFIAIPSREFHNLTVSLAPYLNPQHIIVHGVKGFAPRNGISRNYQISSDEEFPVLTMSELLKLETNVVRIGCLSGPNLSIELLKGLPAAATIASSYDEVILTVQNLLDQDNFKVYPSHHLKGTEIAGALKNIIAIASGLVNGQNLGKNLEAIIIAKGLHEMLIIGRSLDITPIAFIGLAGIGDLIATATSKNSRNFAFGYALGLSNDANKTIDENFELVEGISTTEIMFHYIQKANLSCPVVHMVYDVIFNNVKIREALDHIYEDEIPFEL